jgi:hypothetical protein
MREILKLGEDLMNSMVQATEVMLAERKMLLEIVESRAVELQHKRDDELKRIDRWAESQKEVVKEVFSAMLEENELDKHKHESAIRRLKGEDPLTPGPKPKPTGPQIKSNFIPRHAAE